MIENMILPFCIITFKTSITIINNNKFKMSSTLKSVKDVL